MDVYYIDKWFNDFPCNLDNLSCLQDWNFLYNSSVISTVKLIQSFVTGDGPPLFSELQAVEGRLIEYSKNNMYRGGDNDHFKWLVHRGNYSRPRVFKLLINNYRRVVPLLTNAIVIANYFDSVTANSIKSRISSF